MTDDISKVYLNTGAATLSPVRRVTASGAECHCQCHKNPNVVHVVPCCRLESAAHLPNPGEIGSKSVDAAAPVGVDSDLDAECQMHREMHFRIDGIVMGAGVFEVIHDGGQREAWENTVAAVATLARQLAEAKAENKKQIEAEAALTELWLSYGEKTESALAAANAELANLRAANIAYASEVANLHGRAGLAEQQLAAATRRVAEVEGLLRRYRNEVPLGHQPHMIANLVDDLLTKEPTK